jgi:4-aminobutyrate aminotransferase-like enzyme
MKEILALNAFDRATATALDVDVQRLVDQRHRVMGAASVLFYDTPIEMVSARGAFLYDANGLAYLDCYNNVPAVGHAHPHVTAAIATQLTQLNIHSRYLHRGMHAYAERLLATFPAALSNLTLTCTGSESNDLALRLASAYTGHTGVIVTAAAVSPASARSSAYHGAVRVVRAPDSYRVPAADLGARLAQDVEAAARDLAQQGFGVSALLVDSIFSSDGVYADLMTRFPVIGDVRGAGLYNAVELVDDPTTRTPAASLASAVINGLRQRQVLIGAAGPHGHILKLRPPLCFSREHVDTLVRAITATLASLGH